MPTGHAGETLFVSDLHLSPDRPGTVALFLGFLSGRARAASRLYILGDLFDAWIGDDDESSPNREVRDALRTLGESGVDCQLMHGNRDFLIGRGFCSAAGCRLLKDPARIRIGGETTLLMHGDLLCTDDLAYQRFRRRVRNPLVKRLFLLKSLASRRAMAADYRRKSGAATAGKPAQIMDVSEPTVIRYMRRHRASRLIHGHTHRPADHQIQSHWGPLHRSVLAEWHPDAGEVLVNRAGRWHREPVTPT